MLPQIFSEEHIQVYFKQREVEAVALASECFHRFCVANNMMPPKVFLAVDIFLFNVKHLMIEFRAWQNFFKSTHEKHI